MANSHCSKEPKRKSTFRATLIEVVSQKIEPFHDEKDRDWQRNSSILLNQYIQDLIWHKCSQLSWYSILLTLFSATSQTSVSSPDQLSASPLSSTLPCLPLSPPWPTTSVNYAPYSPGQSPHHLHPTGPKPDKHPTPLPHVIQGHGMSVLAHHRHEVDMRDLLNHLEHLETT